MAHIDIKIYGRVQGVSFRYHTKKVADQLNIKGFVQNLDDGSVRIEAEGDVANLETFVDWCQGGPSMAHVEKVITEESGIKNYKEFIIK